MAQKFESLILSDERFEIPAKRHLGMVVFRLKGENDQTEKLLKKLNGSGKMHAVPASLKGNFFTVHSHRNFFVSSTIFLPLRFYVKSNLPFSQIGKYVIRFTVTSPRTTLQDIARDWNLIQAFTDEIMGVEKSNKPNRVPLKGKY